MYDKIRSPYRISLNSKEAANEFYRLIKAMFILQTEKPNYFNFRTNIGKMGEIEFYSNNKKICYENIAQWVNEEYNLGKATIEQVENLIETNTEKLKKLKIEVASQEIDYQTKEKQISTFLECKKTFFGKFKYFFKYSKNKNKGNIREKTQDPTEEKEEVQTIKKEKKKNNVTEKANYTIEELIELYNGLEKLENELKNVTMDLNSLKLKNKNMDKKIKNATRFIEDIDNHKRSIFEFWKYTNKDEISVLPEGEEEPSIIKNITKVFDYEEDIEEFGKKMDKEQRKKLSKQETDSIYISSTNLIEILNKVKNNTALPKDIQDSLKEIKKQAKQEKTLSENEEFDIFGGIIQDSAKISKINNTKHRELPKDRFSILDINMNTQQLEYKLSLEKVVENIKTAIPKIILQDELSVYKATEGELLNEKDINIFDINPESEMDRILRRKDNKINFFKINLKKGINAVSFTNCIFYDNQNKTLPIGQDLSSRILIDISKIDIKLKNNLFKFFVLKKKMMIFQI